VPELFSVGVVTTMWAQNVKSMITNDLQNTWFHTSFANGMIYITIQRQSSQTNKGDSKMIEIAKEIEKGYSNVSYIGDTSKREISPRQFLLGYSKKIVGTEIECPQSFDSSIIVDFVDGSRVHVANPNQEAFGGEILQELREED